MPSKRKLLVPLSRAASALITSFSPRRAAAGLLVWLLVAWAACFVSPAVRAQEIDPAARGLDVFAVAPPELTGGAGAELLLRTYGYRKVDAAAPLGGVSVSARYEGAPVDAAPVVVTSDAEGLARLSMPPPTGAVGEALRIELTLQHGRHVRVRSVSVRPMPSEELSVSVPRDEVRPGETVTARLSLVDRATGAPRPDAEVELALEQGGAVAARVRGRTGPSGSTILRVKVPATEMPRPSFTLVATAPGRSVAPSRRTLRLQEQVPARPVFVAEATKARVLPGERVEFRLRLRRAGGDPVVNQSVAYLLLAESEATPDGELDDPKSAFSLRAKRVSTDARGEALVGFDAPAGLLVTQRIRVVAKVVHEGRSLSLTSSAVAVTPRGSASVELVPLAETLVPGVEQGLALSVVDGWSRPLAGARFRVLGDGLSAEVETDAHGTALLRWDVPLDVGGRRDRGPCASSVAATVRVELVSGAPREIFGAESVPVCLEVNRERRAVLEASSPVVRAGGRAAARLVARGELATARAPAHVALSVDAHVPRENGSSLLRLGEAWSRWEGSTAEASLEVPLRESAGGLAVLSVAVPRPSEAAVQASTYVLVLPRELPKLVARVTGGRPAPGGVVEVEALLSDERGQPIAGEVAAMVLDKSDFSDEDFERYASQFDTRLGLCARVGVEASHCDAALRAEPAELARLRALLAAGSDRRPPPALDPGKSSRAELEAAFREVLLSLEGAIFEASSSPERLRDALRKGPRGHAFNPELFEVVTQAMRSAPRTPGGEPLTLADLAAIDRQVDYDTVARRVARLKLFRLLTAARSFRTRNDLDADEPALRDPNALLRRMLDEGRHEALLDPWGQTFAFVPARGPSRPFLTAIPGFELRSPGPDGRLGTGDDLSDPFERILKSGTPYAVAMGEDRIADAMLDLRVAESSISAWSRLLEDSTGTQLGDNDRGQGSGAGRLGGSHRTKAPQLRMGATSVTRSAPYSRWLAPVAVDASGIARLSVPLGADETTYRVVLLATPSSGGPAFAHVDVPVSLPLSVRVDPFEYLRVGDRIEALVRVRNRGAAAVEAELGLSASGGARLAGPSKIALALAPQATTTARVSLEAAAEGPGGLGVSVRASSGLEDASEMRFEVRPAGRVLDVARARWVEGTVSFSSFVGERDKLLRGRPRLVVELPGRAVAEAALSERWLEQASSDADLVEAYEIYQRLRERAALESPGSAVERRAGELALRAATRAAGASTDAELGRALRARLRRLGAGSEVLGDRDPSDSSCPPELSDLGLLVAFAEAEPEAGGVVEACWENHAAVTVARLRRSDELAPLARVTLAFVERAHRRELAEELAQSLARAVSLGPDGRIVLPKESSHADRALVLSALGSARAAGLLGPGAPPLERLAAWLSVLRGPDGGFGSLTATRAATAALLGVAPTKQQRDHSVRVRAFDAGAELIGGEQLVKLGSSLELDPRTQRIEVSNATGALVRLEQRALVPYAAPRSTIGRPFSVELRYPAELRAGHTSLLRLRVRADLREPAQAYVRVPLVPGATIADEVEGVTALGDALLVRVELDARGEALPVLVPLRFAHPGSFLAAPAEARLYDAEERRTDGGAVRVVVAP